MGAGTQDSPIAIDDDSEDEVFNELYRDSANASPQIVATLSLAEDRRRLTPPHATPLNTSSRSPDNRNMPLDKKRKRVHSFTSQDASSSNGQRQHPSLVNRLSQPESKKAKKRRRKAERQALEEARVQNINWLNNARPFSSVAASSSSHPALPLAPWIPMQHLNNGYSSQPIFVPESHSFSGFVDNQSLAYRFPYDTLHDPPSYENYDPPPSPPPLPKASSDWVSSMALAADLSFNQTDIVNELPHSSQAPVPPAPPPALPPIAANIPPKQGAMPTLAPKPVEHHALPSKPPPPQPVGTIGMKPDPDPNSKHGIFHITPSTKEAGSDMKKRSASYIPNPARTLVIEQLPKTHRHADFINNWSRSACGTVPVHIFIDGHAGKALIEFASAESARKAWASPKLGAGYANLKPHQLKGKPREDLIKVWWYRVDGVGAGAGVGEIEEGEIEGDAATEKDVDVSLKKETKKERKARLAKEREEKRLRELELRKARELKQQQEWQTLQHQLPNPLESQSIGNASVIATSSQGPALPLPNNPIHHSAPYLPPIYTMAPIYAQHIAANSFGWTPSQPSHQHRPTTSTDGFINKTAYGASLHDDRDERESIASSTGRSESPTRNRPHVQSTGGQGDDLDDYDEDVDMDVDEISPVATSRPALPAAPPIHSSLPPRPAPAVIAQPSKPPTQKPPAHLSSATAPVFVPRAAQNLQPPVSRPPPLAQKSATPNHKPSIMTQNGLITNSATSLSIIAPQPRLSSSSSTVLMTSVSLPPPTSAATAPPASASSVSPSSSSPAVVPSEPKAMKNAPTEPSYTKRALLARQKELEEKIATSKMELAAAAANKAGNATTVSTESRPMSQARPSMDLGGKQAMEDRLRKLVLQSRKPAVQVEPPSADPVTPPSPVTVVAPSEQAAVSKSSSSILSASAPSFSLEDMAVSFITQTIETIRAQPASVAEPPRPLPRSVSQSDVRVELAAKQKRLEEHISESKSLMTELSQARSKDERDSIMQAIREKTRLFEEASSDKAISTTSSESGWTHQSQTTTAQQHKISRWPVNREDAGVLIISDDEDEDDD